MISPRARKGAGRVCVSRPIRFDRSPTFRPPTSLNSLDAFDQLGELGAVLVPYRLDRILERLFVGDLDDLDAGRFGPLERFLLVLRPQNSLFLLRLAAQLREQCLVILRQTVPGLAR